MFLSNLFTKKPHLLLHVKELTINFHPGLSAGRSLDPLSFLKIEDKSLHILLSVLRLLRRSPICALRIRATEGHLLDHRPASSNALDDQPEYPLSCALTCLRFKPGTLENKLHTLQIRNVLNVPPLLVSATDRKPSERKLTSLTIQYSYSTCLLADTPLGDDRAVGPLYPFRQHPSDGGNPPQDIPPPTFSANPYEFLTELNIQDLTSLGKTFAPHHVFSDETAVRSHHGNPELQQGVFRLPNLKNLTLGRVQNDVGTELGVRADNYSIFAIVKHWAPVLENLVIRDEFSTGIIVQSYPLEAYLRPLGTIPLKSLSIIDTGNGVLSDFAFPLIIDSFSPGLQRHKTLQHLSIRFNGFELDRYPRPSGPVSVFYPPDSSPSKVTITRLLALMRFHKLERFDLDMVRNKGFQDPVDFGFGGGPGGEEAARARTEKWAHHERNRNAVFAADLARVLSLGGQIKTRVRIMQKRTLTPSNSLGL